ncbi:uncharacterized protein [Nicotiana tomentosiformis]|uniref:uncharacterized protein n=1 Tax=Nicotiana tomentosiformis TaxID=4098 RepID=UPI00388CA3E3
MPERSYRPLAIQCSSSGYSGHQGSSRSYFSTMPDTSYNPSALQGFPSGYSGHQGQTSGQQSTTLRGCYECGDPSHMKRHCPRLRGKAVQQSQQPLISAPVAAPAVRPSQRGASVLFDPRSTYSYVSSLFAHFLDIPLEFLGAPIYVSTPVGDSIIVDRVYQSCVVTLCGYETRTDLLLLDMTDLEVMLGMDWLSSCLTILD